MELGLRGRVLDIILRCDLVEKYSVQHIRYETHTISGLDMKLKKKQTF